MTHEHEHEHHGHGHGHEQGRHHPPKRKGFHKDWRAWFIVCLMLIAMAIYVLSMDESIRPGAAPGERMPAAGAPPVEAAP